MRVLAVRNETDFVTRLPLAGMTMAKGFESNAKSEAIDRAQQALAEGQRRLEEAQAKMDARSQQVEKKAEVLQVQMAEFKATVEQHFSAVGGQMQGVASQFENVQGKMAAQEFQMTTMIGDIGNIASVQRAGFVGLLALSFLALPLFFPAPGTLNLFFQRRFLCRLSCGRVLRIATSDHRGS